MGLKQLPPYYECGGKETPIKRLGKYTENGNIYLKLESYNLHKSIKSITAYYIIQDIVKNNKANNIVESTSGNLGISLGYFAKLVGLNFLCLVDSTVPDGKLKKLEKYGIKYQIVDSTGEIDPRKARIRVAKEIDKKNDWLWTNQYDNMMNPRGHYEITGPELYRQMHGDIDYLVCSIGTGGTICGAALYLKEKNPNIKIVAVEPLGSTIFGGEAKPYLTAGSGLSGLSKIIEKYLCTIDYYSKVDDLYSIKECIDMEKKEGISVGITTGSVLHVAKILSKKYPGKNIACISPDSGEPYKEIINKNKNKVLEGESSIHPISDIYALI